VLCPVLLQRSHGAFFLAEHSLDVLVALHRSPSAASFDTFGADTALGAVPFRTKPPAPVTDS
jgi:hypothetical protein